MNCCFTTTGELFRFWELLSVSRGTIFLRLLDMWSLFAVDDAMMRDLVVENPCLIELRIIIKV